MAQLLQAAERRHLRDQTQSWAAGSRCCLRTERWGVEGGLGEIGFLWQDQGRKRHLYTISKHQPRLLLVLLKIFQDSSLYSIN